MINKSFTILYVDDDLDDLVLIAEAFEKHTQHLRVIHAHNGQNGLFVLEKMYAEGELPCLVILDINMPIMNGKEMLHRMKRHAALKHIPVVMFSTSSNQSDKEYAKKLGADFITKPNNFRDMESLVATFANKCKLELSTNS